MYPYQGEARYPVEFGPGQSPMPMEHSGMARYGYPGYFPTKGPDGAAYDQNSVPQHAPPSLVGGKPGAMAGQEGMYGPGWVPGAPGQGYVAAAGPGKAVGKQDYFHGHMSSRRREMAVPRGVSGMFLHGASQPAGERLDTAWRVWIRREKLWRALPRLSAGRCLEDKACLELCEPCNPWGWPLGAVRNSRREGRLPGESNWLVVGTKLYIVMADS